MSGSALNQEELDEHVAEAIKEGYEVIWGNDHTLLIDLDSIAAMDCFEEVLPTVLELFPVKQIYRWISKSNNRHVMIELDVKLPWEVRYALEAALGSDGVRTALAIRQMENGCKEASVLFRRKDVAVLTDYNDVELLRSAL